VVGNGSLILQSTTSFALDYIYIQAPKWCTSIVGVRRFIHFFLSAVPRRFPGIYALNSTTADVALISFVRRISSPRALNGTAILLLLLFGDLM
jgi:hypothetical protein